ncbi:MAG: ribosomal RNA small subunit methyltransferase A [Candidatus Sacchiramonaceae bacterium]|nr:ribosomal RNA small subunit methyltransferase A [Candidatus Saccharimonadaceae bacterium]
MAVNFNQKSQKKRRTPHAQKPQSKGPNKSLGQHWLRDREILDGIATSAEIENGDFVLEIGPGLGTLTSSLLKFSSPNGKVLAVEFDENLARKLPAQFPGKNLEIINIDFLEFDLDKLPKSYKVAANVPYYITSKIVEKLLTSANKPAVAALLVQKEVAERMVARAGDLSILAIATQIYAQAELGDLVPREFFTPPPKVDSQVVILKTREQNLLEEYNQKTDSSLTERQFFRIVKAGFAAKRKKISKSLSANLALSREDVLQKLEKCQISPDLRAQDLTIGNWLELADIFAK